MVGRDVRLRVVVFFVPFRRTLYDTNEIYWLKFTQSSIGFWSRAFAGGKRNRRGDRKKLAAV